MKGLKGRCTVFYQSDNVNEQGVLFGSYFSAWSKCWFSRYFFNHPRNEKVYVRLSPIPEYRHNCILFYFWEVATCHSKVQTVSKFGTDTIVANNIASYGRWWQIIAGNFLYKHPLIIMWLSAVCRTVVEMYMSVSRFKIVLQGASVAPRSSSEYFWTCDVIVMQIFN